MGNKQQWCKLWLFLLIWQAKGFWESNHVRILKGNRALENKVALIFKQVLCGPIFISLG